MRRASPRHARSGLWSVVLAVTAVILLFSVPVPAKASSVSSASPAHPASPYGVTWNGVDVSTASSPSSALSIDLAQTASLVYYWAVSSAAPVNVSDARLQMFYFGYAVSTRDELRTNPLASAEGNISLSWAPLSIDYLLEGVYRMTASFLAPNGTTLWSETFYVRGTAPYGIAALIPIVLLILIVYEVYALVRSGRYAMLGRPPAAPPPAAPPATTPPTSPPPTEPSPPPAPSEGGSPPPSGGSA